MAIGASNHAVVDAGLTAQIGITFGIKDKKLEANCTIRKPANSVSMRV
jgi:hypothetical protein